jgi:hypothetical protein
MVDNCVAHDIQCSFYSLSHASLHLIIIIYGNNRVPACVVKNTKKGRGHEKCVAKRLCAIENLWEKQASVSVVAMLCKVRLVF